MGKTTSTVLATTLLFLGFLIPASMQQEEECQPNSEGCFRDELIHYDEYEIEGQMYSNNCLRECNGAPKVCYYKINFEPYTTMGPACGDCPRNKTACHDPQCVTADGIEKTVLLYNRMLPGPFIQVCEGDKVVVDLHNLDAHRSTTVHWHGIRQMGTQHSDGVPMVTQCPIGPGLSFRYMFIADNPGSYFYHSHSGIQKIDGATGGLIIRPRKDEDPSGHLYDYDLPQHVVFIQDWIHGVADQKVPGLRTGPESGSSPKSYLINGKGVYVGSTTDPEQLIEAVNTPNQPPVSEFVVTPGKRYRFRLIGSTCLACTVKITIQGHNMTVISADGAGPVTPTEVDAITLNSGDRYDFMLDAIKNVESYWILARGQGSCNDVMQLAILKYKGCPDDIPSSNLPLDMPNGVNLNPTNPTCESEEELCLSELTSPTPAPSHVVQAESLRLLLQFGFHFYSIKELFQSGNYLGYFMPTPPLMVRAEINSITNHMPSSPLLSQYDDIPNNAFCNRTCYEQHLGCMCLNVYKIPLGCTVDLIVADTATYSRTGLTHPYHLHGYNFYILKQGIFQNGMAQGIEEINNWLDTKPMVNLTHAIQKDSIGIPSGGYVVLRLLADNPGFWIFHCHFTLHLDVGMSAILQVGDVNEMPSTPKGFPKCGDYLPSIHF